MKKIQAVQTESNLSKFSLLTMKKDTDSLGTSFPMTLKTSNFVAPSHSNDEIKKLCSHLNT